MFRRLLRVSRRNSLFLFGARGTGKTTYIGEAFDADASWYVDLLDPEVEDRYRRSPGRLEGEVRALPAAVEWILIDEVQRVPRLLDVAHRLIESTGKRFVLTGSSGRKLRSAGPPICLPGERSCTTYTRLPFRSCRTLSFLTTPCTGGRCRRSTHWRAERRSTRTFGRMHSLT